MANNFSELVFALTAGIFTIFSPCSYALLPGYVSYYLGAEFSVKRAFSGGAAATLGLVTVFSVIGILASLLGTIIREVLPILDLVAGIILVVMGTMTLIDKSITIHLSLNPLMREGYAGFYLFGLIYGLAGVGCSAPIFISILVYSMSKGIVLGILTFTMYAVGMGLPLVATSILMAQAKDYAVRRISNLTPILRKVSGAVLTIVGLYLLYFYYNIYLTSRTTY